MADRYNFEGGGIFLSLIFYTEKTVRVVYSAHPSPRLTQVTEVAPPPEAGGISRISDSGERYLISTGSMTVSVDKVTLDIEYLDRDGAAVSYERGASFERNDVYRTVNGVAETRLTVDGEKSGVVGGEREFVREAYSAGLHIAVGSEERLFGLGCHEEGFDVLNGRFLPLYQENMRVSLPVIVSSRGYGYFYNCASFMTFDATDSEGARLFFDTVDAIDCFFVLGGSFDSVCRELGLITGKAPMLPMWACGYVQSKERYKTAGELVEVAGEYRCRGIPLDVIVQDWRYWRDGMWGDKHFDPVRYPEPEKAFDALHDMGVHVMISVWPNMTGPSQDRMEFEREGLFLADGAVYDAFSPRARELYARQALDGLFDKGIDGWWCDSSEPYDTVWGGAERPPLRERMEISVSEFKKTIDPELINAYSLVHSKGIYQGQRDRSAKRVINLTRSCFPGQHRYATVVWSGDISASWETLRRQVHCMQNFIACGEPYWSSDTGAFFTKRGAEWFRRGEFPGGCQDPAYRELYVRWMEFSCFTPFMRSHGTDTPREIWRFGEPGEMYYDAIAAAIRLRYKLLPYFYSVNASVTFRSEMPVRPLALEFTGDARAAARTDEYMYGHELLVCPITEPFGDGGVSVRDVYLPALPQGGWYDLLTERFYEGGRSYELECGIGSIPVFVRSGALIPMLTKNVGSTDDVIKNRLPYEVTAYPGADGSFTLYEDAGDGYGYENGQYSMRTMTYSEKSRSVSEVASGQAIFRHPVTYRIAG